MGNFQAYDPREPQQQQQQIQWQAPQSHERQPEWQAPQHYTPYAGQVPVMVMEPPKSWLTTVLLCQFLGTLGVHRFYTGRIVSGIFQLLTLGGFGIWTLIDLIMIYTDSFKDDMGLLLTRMARAGSNVYMYPSQVKG